MVLAKRHEPDLIILDIYMPRLDGFGAATLIRDDAALDHVPILAISAVVNSGDGSDHAGSIEARHAPGQPGRPS